MNRKYSTDSRPRRVDRQLSDPAPINWEGFINGTTQPTVNFNVELDPETTKVIYIATGTLSGAILIAAFINWSR